MYGWYAVKRQHVYLELVALSCVCVWLVQGMASARLIVWNVTLQLPSEAAAVKPGQY